MSVGVFRSSNFPGLRQFSLVSKDLSRFPGTRRCRQTLVSIIPLWLRRLRHPHQCVCRTKDSSPLWWSSRSQHRLRDPNPKLPEPLRRGLALERHVQPEVVVFMLPSPEPRLELLEGASHARRAGSCATGSVAPRPWPTSWLSAPSLTSFCSLDAPRPVGDTQYCFS